MAKFRREIMSNEELETGSNVVPEDQREIDGEKGHKFPIPSMKINCDLEITVGSENKIIYVCPGKLQYFTASAVCCSDEKTIEIEYCGHNTKCICGEPVICGCLGFYKIVKSGIIFIPRHKLSEFPDDLFPTDVLCFKVKDRDLKFDVVFTSSRCVNHKCDCNKRCRF
jgi:hypothetical protein